MVIVIPIFAIVYIGIDIVGAILITALASIGGVFENMSASLAPLLGFVLNVVGSFAGLVVAGAAIGRFANGTYENLKFTRLFAFIVFVALIAFSIYSLLTGASILPTLGGFLPVLYLFIKLRASK